MSTLSDNPAEFCPFTGDRLWDWRTSTEPPPSDEPLPNASAFYARMGIAVVPLVDKNPSSYGDDWWPRAITDPIEALQVFASDTRYTNVGWAQGYGTVAVDIDRAEKAPSELLALVELGAVNHTRPGRAHWIFTTPDEWGASTSKFPGKGGWGEVRACGGQIVIWGPHPDDPTARYAYDPRQQIPPIPDEMRNWLTPRRAYEVAATSAELEAFTAEHAEDLNPKMAATPITRADADLEGGRSIHVTAAALVPSMLRDVRAGLYPAADAVAQIRSWWDRAWTKRAAAPGDDRSEPRRGELDGLLRWGLAQAMQEPADAIAATRERFGNELEALDRVAGDVEQQSTSSERDQLTVLPDEFWAAREILAEIRQAARSSLAPPDAVLNAVLARVAAATPHTVKIPGGVGLTYYAAAIGWPGSGKTVATRTSRLIVPPPNTCPELPGGTGEGVVESYFDFVDEENESGKTVKVKRQVRHNLLTIWDEGTQLDETADRKASTILTVLRAAYSDDVLGMTTGSLERRRVLSPGQYVLGVIIGFQPTRASGLLADVDAGTPQRFVWLAATDPGAPDQLPEWPDGLLIEPVTNFQLEPYKRTVGGYTRHELVVPTAMTNAALAHRQRGLRGKELIEPMDVHEPMVRSKVAALLALLEQRTELTDEDWQLAGVVMATSRAVRTQVQEAVADVGMVQEATWTERQVRREARSEEAAYARALASAAGSVGRKVAREGSASKRTLARAISGKHRQMGVTVDDAIDKAEMDGTIRRDGDQWVTGRRAA